MGVYLGQEGCIELKRTSLDEPFLAVINPSDVDTGLTPSPEWVNAAAQCVPDNPGDYNSSDVIDDLGVSLCTDSSLPAGVSAFDDADLLGYLASTNSNYFPSLFSYAEHTGLF